MSYERVNGGDEEDFKDDNTGVPASRSRIGATVHPDLVIRPPMYYGDGPFDAPSSDDEGEGLIEKQDHVALSNDQNIFDDTESGNSLVVGGNKVSHLVVALVSSAHVGIEEVCQPEVLGYFPSISCFPFRFHWTVCCDSVQWGDLSTARCQENIHGSCIQSNI